MTQALRRKVFSSVLKQEQGWFDKRSTGELVNRLSSDTEVVGKALSANIADGLRSLVMTFAGAGMMVSHYHLTYFYSIYKFCSFIFQQNWLWLVLLWYHQ